MPYALDGKSARRRSGRRLNHRLQSGRQPLKRPLSIESLEARCLLAANQWAIIGDYGDDNAAELAVANMVKSWSPAYVITVGDNNYDSGAALTIDANIGKYYQEFIGNYTGSYGPGSATNRFFPALGNHDWAASGAQPYLDYFTLPGNERYYDFVQGSTHFFAIDSDAHEPHGNTTTSLQAQWLQAGLAGSTSPFNVVYFHHPPYSSGSHGNQTYMQWPFKQWGADIVLTGHDHDYERITVDGFPYVVAGNGGRPLRSIGAAIPGSQVRYDADFGALRVTEANSQLTFEEYSVAGGSTLIDSFALNAPTPDQVSISIGNRTVTETDSGTINAAFTISLSKASSQQVMVRYTTVNQTAAAGSDYVAKTGTVTFAPGVTSRSFSIAVNGDLNIEGTETFAVELSSPSGAVIADSLGLGTIADNDASSRTFYFSLKLDRGLRSSDGSSLNVTSADIIQLDLPAAGGFKYQPYFDGSDVGLDTIDEDVDAFTVLPDGSIVLSTLGPFSVSTTYSSSGVGSGPIVTGTNGDLLKFTPTSVGDNTLGSWSVFLRGASVGLETTGEDIDGVNVLPDGRVVVSTSGNALVATGVAGKDEDLLILTPSTGAWALYFDGSDVGLDTSSSEDTDGLFIEPSLTGGNPTLYFTTRGDFSVTGAAGKDEDIVRFTPSTLGATTTGTFDSTLTFDGSLYGLSGADLDGFNIKTTPTGSPSARAAPVESPVTAAKGQSAPLLRVSNAASVSSANEPASNTQLGLLTQDSRGSAARQRLIEVIFAAEQSADRLQLRSHRLAALRKAISLIVSDEILGDWPGI